MHQFMRTTHSYRYAHLLQFLCPSVHGLTEAQQIVQEAPWNVFDLILVVLAVYDLVVFFLEWLACSPEASYTGNTWMLCFTLVGAGLNC